MRLSEIVWVREIAEKVQRKHGLTPEEVEEACFASGTHIRKTRDDRYALLGCTDAGRRIFVVFQKLGHGRVILITARDMTDTEQRLYERHAHE
ncbi:MAG: BrnT family toxin [Elusimicrobiota bacterium]